MAGQFYSPFCDLQLEQPIDLKQSTHANLEFIDDRFIATLFGKYYVSGFAMKADRNADIPSGWVSNYACATHVCLLDPTMFARWREQRQNNPTNPPVYGRFFVAKSELEYGLQKSLYEISYHETISVVGAVKNFPLLAN